MEKTDSKTQKSLSFSHRKKYKMIGKTDEYDWITCEIYNQKDIILKYLKSFNAVLFTTGRVFDKNKNTSIQSICNNSYIDGEYMWSEEEVYCFEKYNMPLNDDFINHVLKQSENQNNNKSN